MEYLKIAKEYMIAFEQGNLEKAKKLLLAHPEHWQEMRDRYELLLQLHIEKTMPGCREKFQNQKMFLDNIVLEAGKTAD